MISDPTIGIVTLNGSLASNTGPVGQAYNLKIGIADNCVMVNPCATEYATIVVNVILADPVSLVVQVGPQNGLAFVNTNYIVWTWGIDRTKTIVLATLSDVSYAA